MTPLDFLYIVAGGLYGLNALLALLIVAFARPGPDYWPALSLVALSSGVPGVYFFILRILRWFGLVDRVADVPTVLTICLIFLLCCFLQGSSVRRVRAENAKYFRRAARRRHLWRIIRKGDC